MKLIIELGSLWILANIAFVIQRIHVARKREEFMRWHESECAKNRKQWGMQ